MKISPVKDEGELMQALAIREIVFIEEREGSDSADYAIRAMQSHHRLVQAVPLKMLPGLHKSPLKG